MRRITVFGGSQMQPGSRDFEQAERLGSLLAQDGFTVQTGGYIGAMEAVSRGANQAGGQVIGMTCDQIEAWRPVKHNAWVMEEKRFPTLRLRLFALIEESDAALALPGGIGTLAEVAEMWSHMQSQAIPQRPLILIGAGWKTVIDTFWSTMDIYILEQYRELLTFAPDVDSAVRLLKTALGN